MTSWKLLVASASLLVMAAGCKLSEQEIASGRPTTISTGPTSGTSTRSGTTSGSTSSRSDANLAGLVISDPLTNGESVGTAVGGAFTAEGYRLDSDSGSYLAYSTGITGSIRVEFDATGYQTYEGGEKRIVIEIFDTSHETSWGAGPVWDTASLCQVKKVDDRIRIKSGARGSWAPEGAYVGSFDWSSYMVYHWVINAQNGVLDVTRNGEAIIAGESTAFMPSEPMNIRIGGSWSDYGSAGVTYSNVQIYALN